MSAKRGIEIHNGYVKMTNVAGFQAGLEATPITQGIAGQVVVSAVIDTIALGGDVKAGIFIVNATVNQTGNPIAIHAQANIAAGITLTGTLRAGYIQSSIGDGSTLTGEWNGLRINQYAHTNATLSNNVYGLHINSYIQKQPSGTYVYHFIRCSENGGITMRSPMLFTIGGGGDCEYVLQVSGTPITAWSPSLNPPGTAHGRLRVLVHSEERWIQLYLPT